MTKTASAIRIVRLRTVSLERQRFALQTAAHGRRHDVLRGLVDEIGGVADGHTRLQVEENRDAGELVQVVHGLRAERSCSR